MRRSSAPTLQDIAREAGVSAMTVSAVLNGGRTSTRVSDGTRARIEETAVRLRYRPNAAARGLQRRRMDVIGVVAVMDYGPRADLNLYFLEVLNGIMAEASGKGQNTMMFSILDWAKDSQRVLNFSDGRVDGMILIGPSLTEAFVELLNHQIPFVTIHADGVPNGVWNLDVDNEGGAFLAVNMLIEAGHRRIVHVTGALSGGGTRKRAAGYRRALEEAGIPVDESLILPGNYSKPAGERVLGEFLDSGRPGPLPTAVFAGSDAIAIGCIRALTSRGLRVPQDVSVVGFDDTVDARMQDPPISTVRQPFREFGTRAVDLLLQQIRGDSGDELPGEVIPAASYFIELPVERVDRASIAPPRD